MPTRVQWLGHACLLFESGGKHVLVDPFLTGNPKAATTAEKVPADLILISHGHGDHVGDAVAIAKRTGAKILCNYEISEWLMAKQGLPSDQVLGLQHGGGTKIDGIGRVKLTLAFHGSACRMGAMGVIRAGSSLPSRMTQRFMMPPIRRFLGI